MLSSRIAGTFDSPRVAGLVGQPGDADPVNHRSDTMPASAGSDTMPASAGAPEPGPDDSGHSTGRWNWDVGGAGIRALAAFAVLVAIIAAVLAWQARPDVQPLMPVAPHASGGLAAGTAAVGPDTVVVAVSGRVRRPGLVRLPAGARVADAIEGAGGALPGTDLAMINLARKLTDGELIVVGITPPSGAPAQPGGAAGTGQVNVNTATAEQLQTLPGVGPVLAARIIEYRDQQGGFTSISDLRKVTGIGDARFNELKDRVTV